MKTKRLNPAGEIFRLLFPAMLVIVLLQVACTGEKGGPKGPPPVPVTFATAESRSVPYEITAIGHVEATAMVTIKARVTGHLKKTFFKGGEYVKEGQDMFLIDPEPYQAAYDQAKANLSKNTVARDQSTRDMERYGALHSKSVVSHDEYERVQTRHLTNVASETADKAAVENAALNLKYCRIKAPFSGKTGKALTDDGALVNANDTPLVELAQVEPVYVTFSVPSQLLARIKAYSATNKLKVTADVADDEQPPVNGTLSFIDNKVDKDTGTIKLRGTFDNKEHILWPGHFVNVRMALTVEKAKIVVPARALQTGPQGKFVYTVGADQTAQIRPVREGRKMGEEIIIESGLNATEVVVADGHLRLYPGAKVFQAPLAAPGNGAGVMPGGKTPAQKKENREDSSKKAGSDGEKRTVSLNSAFDHTCELPGDGSRGNSE